MKWVQNTTLRRGRYAVLLFGHEQKKIPVVRGRWTEEEVGQKYVIAVGR